MDEIDLRLLAELQQDASQSNQALADKVFTSPATALRRVRALSDAGVIERTIADAPAGSGPTFAQLIEPEPAVMLAWQTAPTVDFTLVLTVRDMPDYQALVQRLFTAANNVRNVRARFVTQRVKFSTALPLPVPTTGGRR